MSANYVDKRQNENGMSTTVSLTTSGGPAGETKIRKVKKVVKKTSGSGSMNSMAATGGITTETTTYSTTYERNDIRLVLTASKTRYTMHTRPSSFKALFFNTLYF